MGERWGEQRWHPPRRQPRPSRAANSLIQNYFAASGQERHYGAVMLHRPAARAAVEVPFRYELAADSLPERAPSHPRFEKVGMNM